MRNDLDLTNDGTFKCLSCDEVFKVYSERGITNFCPSCGSREFDDMEEEEE